MTFGQPRQPMIFPEVVKVESMSFLPRFAQTKRIKRPVVGMCRRCGREFFTNKTMKAHPIGVGCGK